MNATNVIEIALNTVANVRTRLMSDVSTVGPVSITDGFRPTRSAYGRRQAGNANTGVSAGSTPLGIREFETGPTYDRYGLLLDRSPESRRPG